MKKEADKIIKYLRENFISEEHRHSELHWDCVECQAMMLEGGLEWLKDIVDDNKKLNDDKVDDSHL